MGSTGAGGWWEALYYKNLKKHQPHKNRECRGGQERCGAGRGREEGKTGKLGHSVMYTPVYFRVMTEGGTVGGLI